MASYDVAGDICQALPRGEEAVGEEGLPPPRAWEIIFPAPSFNEL